MFRLCILHHFVRPFQRAHSSRALSSCNTFFSLISLGARASLFNHWNGWPHGCTFSHLSSADNRDVDSAAAMHRALHSHSVHLFISHFKFVSRQSSSPWHKHQVRGARALFPSISSTSLAIPPHPKRIFFFVAMVCIDAVGCRASIVHTVHRRKCIVYDYVVSISICGWLECRQLPSLLLPPVALCISKYFA